MPILVLTLMSRLSTLPKSRQSIFQSGSEQYTSDVNAICPPNLRECVIAMEDCCEEVRSRESLNIPLIDLIQAHEAQQLLRNGTFDLPRMTKVLESQRVTFPTRFPLRYILTSY